MHRTLSDFESPPRLKIAVIKRGSKCLWAPHAHHNGAAHVAMGTKTYIEPCQDFAVASRLKIAVIKRGSKCLRAPPTKRGSKRLRAPPAVLTDGEDMLYYMVDEFYFLEAALCSLI